MTNQINLKRLETWVDNVSIYPPAEMYFQAAKKLVKEEKAVQAVCEQLYRFNWEGAPVPNPIGSLREALREMLVLDRLFEYEPIAPNYDLVVKMVATFQKYAYYVNQELDSMHTKHPKLTAWYAKWKLDHECRLSINAELWAADILRLPPGLQGTEEYDKLLCDVKIKLQEMSK